ncbi:hypothetical protein [Moheibacter stercoris]|uniref:Uncharacterized protein n=1 Tax=Moheibacter stercoris TaxID=1628251 RepID=A0ABV2LPL3_9FLAO
MNSQEIITIYRTQEFSELEKDFKYSVPDAAELVANFIHNEQPNLSSFWLKLDLVYGEYYVFKDEPYSYNLKIAKYNLTGVWFNAKTGEIKRVKNGKSVDVIMEPLKSFPFAKEYTFKEN